jgi:hypothetical protein
LFQTSDDKESAVRTARKVVLAGMAVSAALTGGIAAAAPGATAPGATAPLSAAAYPHHPIFLPTWSHLAGYRNGTSLLPPPPAPPCPIPVTKIPSVNTGILGDTPSQIGPCVSVPETPATGLPFVGNMAYWGGPVQVHPHIYLVFFGWGEKGAFVQDCKKERLVEGRVRATLKCDPDGAGKQMANFVYQLGGTRWAGIQTQYYQTVGGVKQYITNRKDQLAGIWVDDRNKTSARISYHDMAAEAERAVKHFHVRASQLIDSNFVIAQPQQYTDPIAQKQGYCAFHDLIEPSIDPKDYHGLRPGVPYTNMPYVLNQGAGCGQNLVNAGLAGQLDGFTVALGAEDHFNGSAYGGWYDPFDNNENGDKCAYVGDTFGFGTVGRVPGAAGEIRGNHGGHFAVQSLWSNEGAGGVGYCAGTNSDLPL